LKSSAFILFLGKIVADGTKKPTGFMQQITVIVCSHILKRNENKESLKIHISQSKSIQFQRGRRSTHRVCAHSYGLWMCVLFDASNVIGILTLGNSKYQTRNICVCNMNAWKHAFRVMRKGLVPKRIS
jgi:hypothetical protein